MTRVRIITTVLLLFAAVVPVPTVGAVVVSPGTTTQPLASAVTVTLQSIPIWELPAGILVSVLAVSCMEFLFTIRIWTFFGCRRIEKQGILTNAARSRIMSCIRENPGIHLSAIARMTGICMGSLRYHISKLKRTGWITFGSDHHKKRFFENGLYSLPSDKVLVGRLREKTARAILGAIRDTPDAGRNEIARRLGITGAAVTWHIHRLEQDGILSTIHKKGQPACYVIPDEILASLSRDDPVMAKDPAADPVEGLTSGRL